MTLENVFLVVAIPLFVHAGLAFLQAFWKGPSQYEALLGLELNGVSSKLNVRQLFAIDLNPSRFTCRDLLVAALIWNRRLRVVGFIPFLLYLLFTVLLITQGAFKEVINVSLVSHIILGSAVSLQVLYIVLKFSSNIPELLMALHPEYKNSSVLSILLDLKPLWKR